LLRALREINDKKTRGTLAISISTTLENPTHNPKFEGSYLAEGTKRDKWQKD
jgi:hypothetical protein